MGAEALTSQPQGLKLHYSAPSSRARWPKQALLACFFLLGMGLITFTNATKQAADYFNHRYKGMHTNRVEDTCYTAGFTVTLFALFFGGPGLWPNKRARMFHGYAVFLASLVVPILVDIVVSEMTTGTPDGGPRAGLAPWAVGALIGGAAEATVASVLNGEAAALGCNTAASYGKSVGGIFIVVLRIVVKSLLPAAGQLGRLRIGVSIHLALAAVILLGCVLVTSLAIPYLVDLVQQTESAEVPPGLTFQQTLSTAHTAVLGGPQGEAAAAALHAACSLAPMQPTVGSTFGLPLLEVRRLGGFTLKLTRVDSFTAAGGSAHSTEPSSAAVQQQQLPMTATQGGRFDPAMRQSLTRRYIEEHAGAFKDPHHRHQHRRRTTDCSAASDWLASSSRCTTPVKSPLGSVAGATVAAGAGAMHAAEQHMGLASPIGRAPSMRRQLSSVLGRRAPRRSSAGCSHTSRATPPASHRATPPLMSPLSAQGETHTVLVDATCGGLLHTAARQEEQARRASHASAARASIEEVPHVTDEQQQHQHHQQQHVPQLTCATSIRVCHTRTGTASEQQQEQDAVPGGDGEGGDTFSDGGSLSPFPFHSMQLSSQSFEDFEDEEAAKVPLREVLGACWVVMRTVLVFQAAIFLIPIISEQNKAMAGGNPVKGTPVEIYYGQLVELAKLVGSMLGSQFLPVFHPRKPKPMLLGMSGLMASFLAAFVLARHFSGGPAAMLALVFACYAFGGHLNSTAFTLAKEDLPADDSRMAQMVLALSAAVGSWLAYCLSWLWVAVPTV